MTSSPQTSAAPHLPDAIAGYIASANAHDTQAVAAWFTPDAVVKDEGQDRRGLAAITAWKEEVTRKYRPLTQPLGAETTGEKTVVRARVSGDFPGSPVELRYAFTLHGGKIARLEIV
jgi:ketosteroid isomerase-like protein